MVQTSAVGLIALCGLSVILQGCGGDGGGSGKTTPPPMPTTTPTTTAAPAPSTTLRSCSTADPSGDDLQALQKMNWGYRISAQAPLLYTQSKPLFGFCSEDVDLLKTPQTKMTTSSSTQASETNNKVGADVSVSGSYGCFSAAASMSTERISSSKIKSVRIDRKIKSTIYHVAVTTNKFFDKLTQDSHDILINEEPSKIVDSLGEFYATEAEFGGLLMSTSLIEMSKEDDVTSVQAEAEASFGLAGLKVGLHSYDASHKSEAKEFREITILGGEQSIWSSVADQADIARAQDEWGKTVKGDDMFVVGTKLKPIWVLLEGHDDAKAKEIEDFLKAKWSKEGTLVHPFGEDGNYAPLFPCNPKFSERQEKTYPGVKAGKFFCTTDAPTCTASADDCKGHEALPDHWSSDCDGTENACWTGNKIVCFKPEECCKGYTLQNTQCVPMYAEMNILASV